MLIKDFLPSSSLKNFIQCYRIVHFDFTAFPHIPFKAYPPKPEHCLHFFLQDFFAIEKKDGQKILQPAILLTGQRTTLVNQFSGSLFLDVQVVFQPSTLFLLTGIPAGQFTDQHLDATAVFSPDVISTLHRMKEAAGYSELISIAEQFSFRLIGKSKKKMTSIDLLCMEMMRQRCVVSIEKLALQSCLSIKQFKRKFIEHTGVNPKTFARIVRFNRAFNLKNRFPQKEWSSLADTCGYFDYQHLAKDYKDFTGMTPHQFHLLENRSPENVLGLGRSLYHSRGNASLINY